jgi:hypothetical protein
MMDCARPLYLVYETFDLEGHAADMKVRHPDWSDRMCRNVLYWQGSVRARLRMNVRDAIEKLGCDSVTYCPEGHGVNVFATARLAGLAMDKTRRLKLDHHIALIGMARYPRFACASLFLKGEKA